jgi:hypothetical protein
LVSWLSRDEVRQVGACGVFGLGEEACAHSSGWTARGLYLAIQSAVKS